ncbi:MAG: IS110 family transposase [Limisphaerales bacterium]
MNNTTQIAPQDNSQVKSILKLGLDVDLKQITVTVQSDHQHPKPAQSFSVPRLVAWVGEKVQAGHAVHTVYESCGFGYTLHYQLVAAGARSLVISPVRLHPQRRRKNDRLDSRQLCLRLSRYLDGQKDELPTIRIPSVAEQQRRELGRQRKFWSKQVRQLENHGRALRLEHELQTLPAGWAGPRKWKRLLPALSEFLRAHLEPLRAQIVSAKAQLDRLNEQIEAWVGQERLPKGLGRLTLSLLDGEVCDWHRFKHRKAPGSYTGCCPSEHSSGPNQRQGSIDRHGNKHVRVLLVEAVWRLLRYQPLWHARRKLIARMTTGVALRKKTVVALARQLAVDLWRWRTGRASLAELGLLNY